MKPDMIILSVYFYLSLFLCSNAGLRGNVMAVNLPAKLIQRSCYTPTCLPHRYIDIESLGIITRGTQRALIMDQIEADLNSVVYNVQRALGSERAGNTFNTLPIMILFGFSLEMPITHQVYRRLAYLHCCLSKLYEHIGMTTPIDVYLWFQQSSIPYIPQWITNLFPHIIIVEIPKSSWMLPSDSGDPIKWNYGTLFNDDYYLMGRWRLTFATSFTRAMGYKYILQIDDDTFFMDNIQFNIVEHFRHNNIVWGVRNRYFHEVLDITRGLPEFVGYWMRTRRMEYPLGELFDHLLPPDITGLSSEGWDRVHYQGCFQLIDLEFWHDEVVQNFLQLILKTGSDMEQRWQEQAIQNMIRLLFVPTKNLMIFTNNTIYHGKPTEENIAELGCYATYEKLNMSFNVTKHFLEGNRVTMLVHLAGVGHFELLNYNWDCDNYAPQYGPCDNITLDYEYALRDHIGRYTINFCEHFNIPLDIAPILFAKAQSRWDEVLEIKKKNGVIG